MTDEKVRLNNGVMVTPATKGHRRFFERLNEVGATPLDIEWRGTAAKYRIKCAEGHEATPSLGNVISGQGVCAPCLGREDAETAERNFRELVASHGATLDEMTWAGKSALYTARCPNGHASRITPSDLARGRNLCRRSGCIVRNRFYVISNAEAVKFGVTGSDPRLRFTAHISRGLNTLHLLTVKTSFSANVIESFMKDTLRRQGIYPLPNTREHYQKADVAAIIETAMRFSYSAVPMRDLIDPDPATVRGLILAASPATVAALSSLVELNPAAIAAAFAQAGISPGLVASTLAAMLPK